MAKEKEKQGKALIKLLWDKNFQPHKGWETKVLSKKKFKELRQVLQPEESKDNTIAFVTEIAWEVEDKEGKRSTVAQKYLVLREDAGPEIKAHEEAHTYRWNYVRTLDRLDLVDFARDEILAWIGAEKRRKKKLRSNWLLRVGYQILTAFPEETPSSVVILIDSILQEYGRGLSEEKKQKLLQELEEVSPNG